jgi:hypothetical protein
MNPETTNEIKATIDPWKLAFRLIWLESRCDALQTHIVHIREELDLPRNDLTDYGVEELTRQFLQTRLERLEKENPGVAAVISNFRNESDLPDEYL